MSKQLLQVCVNGALQPIFSDANAQYFWQYDNQGLRLAQLRFYPLATMPVAVFTTYSDLGAFAGPVEPVPEEPRLLFVGVLERYKNVHVLVDAWRRVASALPDVHLHVVGRGREHAVVEQLVRDLPQRVTWNDWLPSDRVAAA